MSDISPDEILARILEYLAEQGGTAGGGPLSADTRLIEDLHLDSMEGAQLLSALEDHYHVDVPLHILQNAECLRDVAVAVAAEIAATRRL